MSKWLISGSVAQLHWFPDSRPARDIDIVTPDDYNFSDEYLKTKACPIDTVFDEANKYILEHNKDKTFVDPEFLLATKIACLHWKRHYKRNYWDAKFLKSKNVVPDRKVFEMVYKRKVGIFGEPDNLARK